MPFSMTARAETGGVALDDGAGRFHADRRRRLDHAVESLADVDVDVVHADRRLTQANLTGCRGGRVQPSQLQHVGTSECRRHHALRIYRVHGARASPSSQERREAGEDRLVHLAADELRAALQLALEHQSLEAAGLLEEERFRRGQRTEILATTLQPLRQRLKPRTHA